jgi:hypothetical protein
VDSWTEEEARAYLPRLRTLLALVRHASQVTAQARGNGHSEASHREHTDAELPGIGPGEALEELDNLGIILRDPSRGLVDFPSKRASGRVVLLCWLWGEDDLAWWHFPEDGFAGRRPLPVPPEV